MPDRALCVEIPWSSSLLNNTLNPDGTLYINHDFIYEVNAFTKVQGSYAYLAIELIALDDIRNSGILVSRRINVVMRDDRSDPLIASQNLIDFVTTARNNKQQYGQIVGVVGGLGDISASLAMTSGSLGLAHVTISSAYDFLNRKVYPYHISTQLSPSRIVDSIMSIMASQGWNRFTLLCSLDVAGRSFRDYVVNNFPSFVIAQETFSVNALDMDETLDLAMQNIVRSGNRIIVIRAVTSYGAKVYTALERAKILNNPRYVILGRDWLVSPPKPVGNIISPVSASPSTSQLHEFLLRFTAKCDQMNMTATQKQAAVKYIIAASPYIRVFYNSIYSILYAAATLWNKNASTIITGQNMITALTSVNITSTLFFPLRYDNITQFALDDVVVAVCNQTTKAFSDARLIYTAVTPHTASPTAARSDFTLVNPLVWLDGTTQAPPDRPIYQLLMFSTEQIRNIGNLSNSNLNVKQLGIPVSPNITINMESGTSLPNQGLTLFITDQTGLVISQQIIVYWTQALNGNPIINAYVTQDNTTNTSASLSGPSSVKLLSTSSLAIADFSNLIISAHPGSTAYLHFECILPGGFLLTSPILTLVMNDCDTGHYIDAKSNLCQPCPDGYDTQGNKNTQTCVPILHEISINVTATFIALGSLGIVIATLVFGYVVKLTLGHSRTIYHYSPAFCMVSLFGMVLVFGSVIAMVINPVSSCTSQSVATWLFNIGFTFCFGSMFAKTYRLYKIFNNILLYMTAISNKQLYTMLVGLAAMDIILLAIWQGVDPYTLNVASYRTCDNGSVGSAIKYTLIGIKGSLLLIGMYLTHATRNVPSAFNEHKASTIGIYNASVIGVVIIGIWFGMKSTSGEVTITIVQAAGAWIGALSTLGVIFGHLLYDVYVQRVPIGSKGKGTAGVLSSNGVPAAGGLIGLNVSSQHYSILESLAAEIHNRHATCHADKEFLEEYAKLQSIMKTLSTNQYKKNAILQKLAEICADKDYRGRCGQLSEPQQQQPRTMGNGMNISCGSIKDDTSNVPRGRQMSTTPTQAVLLGAGGHRSSVTLDSGSGPGLASPMPLPGRAVELDSLIDSNAPAPTLDLDAGPSQPLSEHEHEHEHTHQVNIQNKNYI